MKKIIYLIFVIALLISLILKPKLGVARSFMDEILIFIENTGYSGIFITMTLESAMIPIPSEIVVPFSGFLITKGIFNFWIIVLITSLANLFGSIIAYFVGLKLGREFVIRWGKYFLIKEKFVKRAELFFEKWGEIVVFVSRMMPAIRTFISLPAGFSKMNFKKFVIFTFLGSLPWNFVLTYSGIILAHNWVLITNLLETYELFFIILAIFIFTHHFLLD